jgi:hypothetical protein
MIRNAWAAAVALAVLGFAGCNNAGEPDPNDMKGVAPGGSGGAPAPGSTSGRADYPGAQPSPGTGGDAAQPAGEADAAKPEGEGDAAKPEGGDSPQAAAEAFFTPEELAAIKTLPEDEAALAIAQRVCPSSGAHLGAMDAPYKVTVGDEVFFLCCEGCKGDVDADPQGMLAKAKAPKK